MVEQFFAACTSHDRYTIVAALATTLACRHEFEALLARDLQLLDEASVRLIERTDGAASLNDVATKVLEGCDEQDCDVDFVIAELIAEELHERMDEHVTQSSGRVWCAHEVEYLATPGGAVA